MATVCESHCVSFTRIFDYELGHHCVRLSCICGWWQNVTEDLLRNIAWERKAFLAKLTNEHFNVSNGPLFRGL